MRALRLLACCALFWAAGVWAQVPVPALKARVTDLSATLAPAQQTTLESQLKDVEAHGGAQIAVLIVPTTLPETIEQYSIRVAEAWKLGKKGVDNGVLLLVAKNDRKVRIEVGYGLEGVIPDAIAKRLIEDLITPRFKQGDYAGGLSAGVLGIASAIEAPTPGQSAAQNVQPLAATVVGAIDVPPLEHHVNDLAGVLPAERREQLEAWLIEHEAGRGDRIDVLVMRSCAPESIAQFSARALASWRAPEAVAEGRSVLLVLTTEDAKAQIAAGYGVLQLVSDYAAEVVNSAFIAPALKQQDYAGAITAGVGQIASLLDGGPIPVKNDFARGLLNELGELPWWLLALIVIAGTALRWYIGPLWGGLSMGGLVGGGAWLVTGSPGISALAGGLTFVFVLVGLLNWVSMALDGSSSGSSSGGGGFSGGGGSFGGGGASGSW